MAKELTIKKEQGTFKNKENETINYEKLTIFGFDGIFNYNVTDKQWVKRILDYKKQNPNEIIVIKGQL